MNKKWIYFFKTFILIIIATALLAQAPLVAYTGNSKYIEADGIFSSVA